MVHWSQISLHMADHNDVLCLGARELCNHLRLYNTATVFTFLSVGRPEWCVGVTPAFVRTYYAFPLLSLL